MRHSDAANNEEQNVTTKSGPSTAGCPASDPSTSSNQPRRKSPQHSFEMEDSASLGEAHARSAGASSVRSAVSRTKSTTGSALRRTMFKGVARHTVGLILLLAVVFLWTLSNFLGSSIFADASYAKPFFLTYLNTSIFLFAMIPTMIRWTSQHWRQGTLRAELGRIYSTQSLKAFFGRNTASREMVAGGEGNEEEAEAFIKANRQPPPSSQVSTVSSYTPTTSDKDDTVYLDLIPTARLSLAFCILWFGANYFAMGCLQYTTVASATILTSTSSIWTLLIGALSRTEKFTWRKLCGVLASLAGIILISRVDLSSPSEPSNSSPSNQQQQQHEDPNARLRRAIDVFPDKPAAELALGDALALLSAVIYGFYTITLKRSTIKAAPKELHMPTFFGLVGLFNIVLLLPLFPILHLTGIETFMLPPTKHIWTVLVVNSISSFASDIMWAYAMVFTSPLLVTVGLSLTIPLSLIGEMVVQARYESWMYWIGAMVVVGSFVFVEREEVREEEEEEEEEEDEQQQEEGEEENSNRDGINPDRDVERGHHATYSTSAPHRQSLVDDDLTQLMGSDDEDDVTRDRLQRQADGFRHD